MFTQKNRHITLEKLFEHMNTNTTIPACQYCYFRWLFIQRYANKEQNMKPTVYEINRDILGFLKNKWSMIMKQSW